MFIDDAPIDKLPINLKAFINNVINTKLFTTVKFISCLADAKNLMDFVSFEIKRHGNTIADNRKGSCTGQLGVNLSQHTFAT